MARPRKTTVLFLQFIEHLAEAVAERMGASTSGGGSAAKKPDGRRKGGKRRALEMGCRVPGCKNRSRGPRFGFICDDHLKKLSKSEQADARAKWNAKR